jgi:tRNA pseudouridine55 synthase
MDGIIDLNKPVGISSAKALYRVRSITGQRKSGHAGTLDPGASGVLVLCLGRATKLVERVMDQPKVYRATARLDVTSESFDSDRPLKSVEVLRIPTEQEVAGAFQRFEGVIEQAPPAISAVKVAGRPAYKRAGTEPMLTLKPRAVRIDWIHLHSFDWPHVEFEMACGRGTYVRSLIRDVGQTLGSGGCLTSLARLRVGPFSIEDAWTTDRLAESRPQQYVIPIAEAQAMLEAGCRTVPPRPTVGA